MSEKGKITIYHNVLQQFLNCAARSNREGVEYFLQMSEIYLKIYHDLLELCWYCNIKSEAIESDSQIDVIYTDLKKII